VTSLAADDRYRENCRGGSVAGKLGLAAETHMTRGDHLMLGRLVVALILTCSTLSSASDEFVHQFHDGISREIWKRYGSSHLEPAVAWAVAAGVLRKEELSTELLLQIAGLIGFYEADLARS
jgi:hypothetical protein